MLDQTLGAEVHLTAPDGSPVTAILDRGECAYHARFALVETPRGAYTVEREIHSSEFFYEDAEPSLKLGRRLYLAENGKCYTLDQLTITDAYGSARRVTARPELIPRSYVERYRRRVQDALRAAPENDIDVRAFALGVYLGDQLAPEQAVPLANATTRDEDGEVHIDLNAPDIPWPEPPETP